MKQFTNTLFSIPQVFINGIKQGFSTVSSSCFTVLIVLLTIDIIFTGSIGLYGYMFKILQGIVNIFNGSPFIPIIIILYLMRKK